MLTRPSTPRSPLLALALAAACATAGCSDDSSGPVTAADDTAAADDDATDGADDGADTSLADSATDSGSSDSMGTEDGPGDATGEETDPDGSAPVIDPEVTGPPAYRTAAPIEVFRDATGTAHVYAQSAQDAVFGQGYEMARDRLFHLAYLRHFIYGERALHYGPAFVNDDRIKRAVGFRRIARENGQFYKDHHPEVFALMQAYAAGVNAYLDDARLGRNGAVRPSEFDRIDPDWWPEPWSVADTVAVAKGTVYSQSFQPDFELAIFAGELLLGPAKFHELLPFTPMYATHIMEESPSDESMLSLGGPGGEGSGSLVAPVDPALTDAQRQALGKALAGAAELLAASGGRPRIGVQGGSNSWAVAGAHTASAGAILCNDTHMSLEQPSRLYPTHIVDLSHDDTGAQGYIAPGAPLVLIGNNRNVAWGLTNSFADVGDLYRETLDATGTHYTRDGVQYPVDIAEETILVRPEGGSLADATPQTVRVRRIPGHGPMLNDLLPDELRNILDNLRYFFSIRWSGFEATSSDMEAFRHLLVATNLDEQASSLRWFNTGVMNWTLADAGGRVGYVPAGPFPIRTRGILDAPPYLPLAGTGGDEWQGFLPYDQIPQFLDPAKGYIVTANNPINEGPLDNDPKTTPLYFGHFFDLSSRAHEITAQIEQWKAGPPVELAQNRALQVDNHAIVAQVYLPLLQGLRAGACESPDSDVCVGLSLLDGWDRSQPVDSAPAVVFNLWTTHFLYETLRDDVQDPLFGLVARDLDNVGLRATANWLQGRTPPSGKDYFDDSRTRDVTETAQDIALRAMQRAMEQARAYFGADRAPGTWAWGEAHKAQHKHVVFPDLSTEPAPKDSSFRAVNPADFPMVVDGQPAPLPYIQDEGAQIRYCVDLGGAAPTISGGLNGGVSAHSGTPHWLDQIPGWLAGETYAVPYLRADVEAQAVEHHTLEADFPEAP